MQPEHGPDLGLLFAPRVVALVGATEDETKFGGAILAQMIRFGYPGSILPVNPRRSVLHGLRCFPSVAALPERPDHVGIVVPPREVPAVLQECARIGVPFATIFTSGFAESGSAEGRTLQAEAVEVARRAGIRLMGPNCNGVVNFVDRFSLTSSMSAVLSPPRGSGNIAIVSQSGGLGQVNVMWRAMRAGLAVNYQVSCGNEADLDATDFGRFMVEQASTTVLLMALEGVRDGGKFLRLAERAAELGKPIVALKFGQTELGRRMAASHTGALAGADDIFDAACRQFGVLRVGDTCELYEAAIMLRDKRRPQGARIAAIAPSGGNAVHVADVGGVHGLEWVDFSPSTQQSLRAIYPERASVDNPIDTRGRRGVNVPSLEAIAADPAVDVALAIFTITKRAPLEQACALAASSAKPVVILWTGRCEDDDSLTVGDLVARGIAVYSDTGACMAAIGAAATYRSFLARFSPRSALRPPVDVSPATARSLLDAVAPGTLTERQSKEVLRAYGIPGPAERLALSADEAWACAQAMGGPVALKIESPDIPHKTDIGAVLLDLAAEDAIRAGYATIMVRARTHVAAARIHGVLVQRMAGPGTEVILGVIRDPVFGPVVMVGLGGIFVEALRDVTYCVAPVHPDAARAALQRLKGRRVLDGLRGRPPADVEALVDSIVRISWLAWDMRDVVEELDVNPLLALGHGVLAVDALVVKRAPDSSASVAA